MLDAGIGQHSLEIALADAAARKGYAKGANALVHMSNDAGHRAALSLQFRST